MYSYYIYICNFSINLQLVDNLVIIHRLIIIIIIIIIIINFSIKLLCYFHSRISSLAVSKQYERALFECLTFMSACHFIHIRLSTGDNDA